MKWRAAGDSKIMGEHDEQCDDHGDEPCPICRGEELDPDFLAPIQQAGAQPGMAMTFDEAMDWLRAR